MEEPNIKLESNVKRRKWCDNETEIFLKSWKDNYHIKCQGIFKRQNYAKVYRAIREDLQKHGYDRSLIEIKAKAYRLLKSYRKEKNSVLKQGCLESSPFFFDLVDIEKMELETDFIDIESKEENDSINIESEVDSPIPSDEKGEEIIEEGNDPDSAEVIEDNLQNDSFVSDLPSQFCSADNHSGKKEPGEDVAEGCSTSVNNQHPPSNDLQITTEDVLLGFYKAFRKANRQLKKNDTTLLQLLKDQNEIFKSQTALMVKLISRNKVILSDE